MFKLASAVVLLGSTLLFATLRPAEPERTLAKVASAPFVPHPPAATVPVCSDCPPTIALPLTGPLDSLFCEPGLSGPCLPTPSSPPLGSPFDGGGGGGGGGETDCICHHLEADLAVHFGAQLCGKNFASNCLITSICTIPCLPVPKIPDPDGDDLTWPEDPDEEYPWDDGLLKDSDGDELPDYYDLKIAAEGASPEDTEWNSNGVLPLDFLSGENAQVFVEEVLTQILESLDPAFDKAAFLEGFNHEHLPDLIQDLNGDGFTTGGELLSQYVDKALALQQSIGQDYHGADFKGNLAAFFDYQAKKAQLTSLSQAAYILLNALYPEAVDGKLGKALAALVQDGAKVAESVNVTAGENSLTLTGAGGNKYTLELLPSDSGGVKTVVKDGSGAIIDPEGVGDKKLKDVLKFFVSLFGDPVNTSTGAFAYHRRDLEISGRGPSLVLERHYSSRLIRSGILGPNWSMPLLETHMLVCPGASGAPALLIVFWGNGEQSTFKVDELEPTLFMGTDGEFGKATYYTWTDPNDTDCTNMAPSLVVRRPDGSEYYFCAPSFNGAVGNVLVSRLRKLSDAEGNSLTFRRDAEGRAYEVVDTLGRTLTLEYDNGNTLLSKVTDWTGREWRYIYDMQRGGELKRVEYPQTIYLDGSGVVAEGVPHEEYTYHEDPDTFELEPGSLLNHNLLTVAENGDAPRIVLDYYIDEGYSYDKVREYAVDGAVTEFQYTDLLEGADLYDARITHLTEARTAEGFVERFYHGETGVLLRHETVNGRTDANWSVIGDVYTNPTEGVTHNLWMSIYDYDDDYRALSRLETTDVLYPAGRKVERFYDSANPDRFQSNNLIEVRVHSFPFDPAVPFVSTQYEYDPLTALPRVITDGAGNTWTRTFAHHELSYADARALDRVEPWGILPDPGQAPSLEALFDLGDVNGDGALGGSFHPVRMTEPPLAVENPAGPGNPSQEVVALLAQYDEFGQLVKSRDRRGVWTQIGHQGGYPTSQTVDPGGLGLLTTYSYDALGRIVLQTDPDTRSTETVYDARGNAIEHRAVGATGMFLGQGVGGQAYGDDQEDIVHQLFYDLSGRYIGASEPQYAGTGPVYAVGLSPNLVAQVGYDIVGRATSVTTNVFFPAGTLDQQSVATADYDSSNRVEHLVTESGAQYDVVYDARGFFLSVAISSAGGVLGQELFDYDVFGQQTRYESAEGLVTEYAIDCYGRVESVTEPTGLVTSYEYDVLGMPTVEARTRGAQELYRQELEYDALGRVTLSRLRRYLLKDDGSVTLLSPEWREESPGWGLGTSELLWTELRSGADARLQRFEYDSVGRRVATYYGTDNSVGTVDTLDVGGRVSQRKIIRDNRAEIGPINPSESTWLHYYDKHGRLRQTLNPLQKATAVEYDASGRITKATDPLGKDSVNVWDSAGRQRSTTETAADGSPPPRSFVNEYDAAGNLSAIVDALGRRTEYDYDAFNRILIKRFEDASEISYEYDADNRIRKATLPSGTVRTYAYDTGGQLSSMTATGADAHVFRSFGYDALDRATSFMEIVGQRQPVTVVRELSSLGDMHAEETSLAGSPRSFQIARNGIGDAVQVGYPSGRLVQRVYDSLGRLTTVSDNGQPIAEFSLPYGLERHCRVDYVQGGGYLEQQYDALGRTTRRGTYDAGGSRIAGSRYGYDAVGSLKWRSCCRVGVREDYAYDGFHRLASWTYDVQNDGVPERSVSWQWDAVDALTHHADTDQGGPVAPASNDLNQITALTPIVDTYCYNADGQEVDRHIGPSTVMTSWDALGRPHASEFMDASGVVSVEWTFDSLDRLIHRADDLGGVVRYTHYGGVLGESRAGGAPLNEYIAGTSADGVVARIRNGTETVYLQADPFGNVEAIHDGSQLLEEYDYDPFGTPRWPVTRGLVTASAVGNELFFLSRPYEFGTGLSVLEHRLYAPTPGQFISRDPAGELGGLNLYSYGLRNPYRWADPTGLGPQLTAPKSDLDQSNDGYISHLSLAKGQVKLESPVATLDYHIDTFSSFIDETAGLSLTGEEKFTDLKLKEMLGVLESYVDLKQGGDSSKPVLDTFKWAEDGAKAVKSWIHREVALAVLDLPGTALTYALEEGLGVDHDTASLAGGIAGTVVPTGGLSKAARFILGRIGGAARGLSVASDAAAAAKAFKAANGNAKLSARAQHGYEIVDTATGKVVKTGVSGGRRALDGGSYRANTQVNKWNADQPGRYEARVEMEVPAGPGARERILIWERENAARLRDAGHLQDPTKHKKP